MNMSLHNLWIRGLNDNDPGRLKTDRQKYMDEFELQTFADNIQISDLVT